MRTQGRRKRPNHSFGQPGVKFVPCFRLFSPFLLQGVRDLTLAGVVKDRFRTPWDRKVRF
jgi:hypothetical protein